MWDENQVLDAVAKFTPAPLDVECVDTWHPGTLSEAAMLAYKALETDGDIRAVKVRISASTGRCDVRYFASCPHEWILDRLRTVKAQMIVIANQIKMGDELKT